jgi:phage terminase large subunit-like protein
MPLAMSGLTRGVNGRHRSETTAFHVRRDKAALFQWVQAPPGDAPRTRGRPALLVQIIKKYEGTRLGRQELNAELLDDVPGALWNRALIEETRWPVHKPVPDLIRIAVAIDPAASSGEEADETGIIVAGKDADGHGYVLADQSGRYDGPTEWARAAIRLYRQYKADRIVAEVNNGGDMVEATIRMVDPNVSYQSPRQPRKSYARRTNCGALRTTSRPPRRCLSGARRPAMRVCR